MEEMTMALTAAMTGAASAQERRCGASCRALLAARAPVMYSPSSAGVTVVGSSLATRRPR